VRIKGLLPEELAGRMERYSIRQRGATVVYHNE
jgi:hypothetical protein